jgi:hypothetical protein
VGWQSPISSEVHISGLIRDMDANCGNGVLWAIGLGTRTLASGSLANGQAQGFADGQGGTQLQSTSVSKGEFLYFVVDPNGEAGCDSTELDLRIESTACSASAFAPRGGTGQTAWQPQSPPASPSPRMEMGFVYDAVRHVVVAVGGTDWKVAFGETWEYDGAIWRLREDVYQSPARIRPAMAYDRLRQVTVLFGGSNLGDTKFFSDTWEYDGNRWLCRSTSYSPSPRNGAAVAYDPVRRRLVLFGGYYRWGPTRFFDDTWEYDGTQWVMRSPVHHPEARETAQMVYDPARSKMVLFGGGREAGGDVYGDTWEWDGNDWTERQDLLALPPARWAHSLAYDEQRQRTILFGGLTGTSAAFDDTWEYDGQTWIQITASPRPSARWDPGMAYDVLNKRTVLFGGMDWDGQFGWLDDTWHYGAP